MPCTRPIKGYRSRLFTENGKRSIVFNAREGLVDQPVNLPCGQCISCRLERSRRWAVRCMHESSLYENNCFITLTFDDDHLPPGGSLVKSDFQDFMKRLRRRIDSNVRYFYCGEYGEKLGRPHFHACLFNYDFSDKRPWRKSPSGDQCYRSDLLEDLWKFGNSEIGSLTFESAAYVARYITKKLTGEFAEVFYDGKLPEYCDMSRRPGIGKPWFDKYFREVYPADTVIARGREMRPPPYYDRLYDKLCGSVVVNPLLSDSQFSVAETSFLDIVKRKRKSKAEKIAEKEPESRLAVLEEAQYLSFKTLKRGLENA